MGFVSQIFGGVGPAAQQANLIQPVTSDQIGQQLQNANSAQAQQQGLVSQLQMQNGIGQQSNILNQQQGLANQLQQQANGQGPNPVQDQFAQNTAANTAGQASLMAGQRGLGDNAGLLARQAANVGANNQQQMTGQSATLGAQQQIAAQGQLANQQAQMQNAASGQAANQIGATNQGVQNAQGLYGTQVQGTNGFNSAQVGNASQANTYQAGQNATKQQQIGSFMSGVGGMLGPAASMFGGGGAAAAGGAGAGFSGATAGGVGEMLPMAALAAHGGQIQADPRTMSISEQLKNAKRMKDGGTVPGKASVAGDSYKNDTVNAKLSPGEVVIPRHIMNGANPAQDAMKFVQAVLAKKGPTPKVTGAK